MQLTRATSQKLPSSHAAARRLKGERACFRSANWQAHDSGGFLQKCDGRDAKANLHLQKCKDTRAKIRRGKAKDARRFMRDIALVALQPKAASWGRGRPRSWCRVRACSPNWGFPRPLPRWRIYRRRQLCATFELCCRGWLVLTLLSAMLGSSPSPPTNSSVAIFPSPTAGSLAVHPLLAETSSRFSASCMQAEFGGLSVQPGF